MDHTYYQLFISPIHGFMNSSDEFVKMLSSRIECVCKGVEGRQLDQEEASQMRMDVENSINAFMMMMEMSCEQLKMKYRRSLDLASMQFEEMKDFD